MYTPQHSMGHGGNTADASREMRERQRKEQDLQIIRNELRETRNDLETAEREMKRLETEIAQHERDVQSAKGEIKDLEHSEQRDTEATRVSEQSARELKDSITRKRGEVQALQRGMLEAKRAFDTKEEEYRRKHDELMRMEREEQLRSHQTIVGRSTVRSEAGQVAQKETFVTRYEGELKRMHADLDIKKREADRLKQKLGRIEPEERALTHELERMI